MHNVKQPILRLNKPKQKHVLHLISPRNKNAKRLISQLTIFTREFNLQALMEAARLTNPAQCWSPLGANSLHTLFHLHHFTNNQREEFLFSS